MRNGNYISADSEKIVWCYPTGRGGLPTTITQQGYFDWIDERNGYRGFVEISSSSVLKSHLFLSFEHELELPTYIQPYLQSRGQ